MMKQSNVIQLSQPAPKRKAKPQRKHEKTIDLRLTMDRADIEELECRAHEEHMTLSELVAEVLHLWL